MSGLDAPVPGDGDRSAAERPAARPVAPTGNADDASMIPEHSTDDTDAGWGEAPGGNDERLLADRPPHWG